MTKKRDTTAGKGGVKKLKLKKETLKDLDPKRKAGKVKGGADATVGFNTFCCGPLEKSAATGCCCFFPSSSPRRG